MEYIKIQKEDSRVEVLRIDKREGSHPFTISNAAGEILHLTEREASDVFQALHFLFRGPNYGAQKI